MLANGRQSCAVLSILLSASFMIYDLYENIKALVAVVSVQKTSSRQFYLQNNQMQQHMISFLITFIL